MRITRLTIRNYGRIENQEIKLDKIDVVETPFVEDISIAIAELLYGDYLRPNLPKVVTSDKSLISCDFVSYKRKIRLEITFSGGERIKKYYVDKKEVQNINEALPFSNNSFEQEMTSLFLNKYRFKNCNNLLSFIDYKNYFAFYKGSKDKTLPSTEFSFFYSEKYFRSLLNNYIRTFKPIWINKDKGIYIKLLNSGEFNSYKLINGKEEECNLSETEQTVFNFIVFLEIGRFWGELNRIKDLNFESKPLIAIDLMEHLDISFDALKYIKDLKQNRQIIIIKEKGDKIMKDQEKSIIHCDYKQLDKILDGFRKGDLVLLGSRPTFGKTTLALNILDNIAHKGYSCAIFSLELLKEQLTQNLLCLRANVSLKKSLEGKLEVNDWEKIAVAKKQIESEKIFVDDSSNLTPEDIESKCKVLIQKEGKLDFIVIDYLQLLDDKEKLEDIKQKQSNISRKLKQIANELNVCIIVTSQLSRIIRDEKRRPELKDLNLKIIEDCDTIIFIHRPDLQDTNGVNKKDIKDKVAEIIVKKNSGNCTVGEVKMYFNNETLRFFEIKGGKING